MNTAPLATNHVTLAHQGIFDLSDAAGLALRCERGCLWITLDNDPRDIVLEAGQTFSTEEHRHLLVYALETSTLSVRQQVLPERRRTRTVPSLRPAAQPA